MHKKSISKTVLLFGALLFIGCSSKESGEPFQLEASCFDNVQNGDETGVDCGGSCSECEMSSSLNIPISGYETALQYPSYTLVWSDEFNDDGLDTSKWNYNIGTGCPSLCGWGNNEQQYFTDSQQNLYFEDGNLIIEARGESISGKDFSSARINSDDKFELQYGRVDIRASMPSAPGTWVALFLLNKNYTIDAPDAFWPSGGEIDVMEYLGENPNEVFGTAHYGTDFPLNHRFDSRYFNALGGNAFDEVFYVFSIVWEEDKITWLINDIEYHSITPSITESRGQPYPFNDQFYLVFALSVGGNLPNVAPKPKDFPAFLIIDYVRVFQKD